MRTSALILAGGNSSRMSGVNKAQLIWRGHTFLENLQNMFLELTEDVLISQKKGQIEKDKHCTYLYDKHVGCGPLSGLEVALATCKEEVLMVAACDMPLLKRCVYDVLLEQLGEYDAVVPIVDGKQQPLAAIYRKRILPLIKMQIESGQYGMWRLLQKLNVNYVEVSTYSLDIEMFKNINNDEDYNKLYD